MENDFGLYTKDSERYKELVDKLYADHGPITLPPEYDYFVQKDLLTLLIRLARYKFVARQIKRTDRLLEIGCGSGLGTVFLSQYCRHVTGLDAKSRPIQEARSLCRRDNVDFVQGDIFELDSNDRFDVVVALDVIEHMNEDQGRKLVAGTSQLIRPTGMLVIGTPSAYSEQFQGPLSKAGHVKCYDKQELEELIETYYGRTIAFSMNDELVHTGFHKLAWYYFILGVAPKTEK